MRPSGARAVHLVSSKQDRAFLQRFAEHAPVLVWLVPLSLALFFVLPMCLPILWQGIGLANVAALTVAVLAMRGTPWATLWRPSVRGASVGLLAAISMLGIALVVVWALRKWFPEFAADADDVYALARSVPATVIPVVLLIVVIEDALWRGAITLPLAARFGPLPGCLCAGTLFAVAHATAGPPVLVLAAWLAGTAWSALTVRTRSLFATACCHATWDLAIVVLGP